MHIQINPINGRKEYFSDYANIGIASCDVCGTPWPDETTTVCQHCVEHAAKQAAQRAADHAGALELAQSLVSIKRTELKKGFRFVGTFADGSTKVLRGVATRPYTFAAIQYFGGVTFHSSRSGAGKSHYGYNVVRVIEITA